MAILVTLVVYKLVLIGIGLYAKSRSNTSDEFFLGGRRLGPFVAAISASASSSSAWTLLGVSGLAYQDGLSAIWLFPSCVGGFILNWYVVAPALRRYVSKNPALTLTEVLASGLTGLWRRYVVGFASLLVFVLFTVYVASQFDAAATTFLETFGADGLGHRGSLFIGAAIVVFYTLLGGFWAVSLTDTLQGMMMALTALLLPLAAFWALGWEAFSAGLQQVSDPHYLSLTHGRSLSAGIGFVLGLFGIGLNYPGQPHVVNRFMALREGDDSLHRARRIAVGWAVIMYAGMIFLGLAARAAGLSLKDGEGVLVASANANLSPVVAGVMIAAILSAIMSTADSQLLVAASSLTHDLGFAGRGKHVVLKSRIVVVLVSLAAVGLVLLRDATIFERVLFAFSALGAAFGPLFLARCFGRKAGGWRSMTAMLLGFGIVLFANLYVADDEVLKPYKGFIEYFCSVAVSAAVAFSGGAEK